MPTVKAPPGSLLIRDTFMPSSMGDTPHGHLVLSASKEEGFKGNVRASIMDAPKPTGFLPEVRKAYGPLASQNLTKEQALSQISQATQTEASAFLNDQSDYLERQTKAGTTNSAANFSLGMSKASYASELYNKGIQSIGQSEDKPGAASSAAAFLGGGGKTLKNYATAFDLDLKKLESTDPKVYEPERQKLQQALINNVSDTFDNNPALKKSKQRWDSAVNGFEAKNNSVVVSAGNEGDYAEMLESGNGGRKLNPPKDFEANLLQNDTVTSVGATQVSPAGKEGRASYSSVSDGVDVYANGTLKQQPGQQFPIEGTSFSAPRVAATMAQLHKDNPNLSSAQVENLMKQSLTNPMNVGNGGSIQVLDHAKTKAYLSK